jgi:hypothetical protein
MNAIIFTITKHKIVYNTDLLDVMRRIKLLNVSINLVYIGMIFI